MDTLALYGIVGKQFVFLGLLFRFVFDVLQL